MFYTFYEVPRELEFWAKIPILRPFLCLYLIFIGITIIFFRLFLEKVNSYIIPLLTTLRTTSSPPLNFPTNGLAGSYPTSQASMSFSILKIWLSSLLSDQTWSDSDAVPRAPRVLSDSRRSLKTAPASRSARVESLFLCRWKYLWILHIRRFGRQH